MAGNLVDVAHLAPRDQLERRAVSLGESGRHLVVCGGLSKLEFCSAGILPGAGLAEPEASQAEKVGSGCRAHRPAPAPLQAHEWRCMSSAENKYAANSALATHSWEDVASGFLSTSQFLRVAVPGSRVSTPQPAVGRRGDCGRELLLPPSREQHQEPSLLLLSRNHSTATLVLHSLPPSPALSRSSSDQPVHVPAGVPETRAALVAREAVPTAPTNVTSQRPAHFITKSHLSKQHNIPLSLSLLPPFT